MANFTVIAASLELIHLGHTVTSVDRGETFHRPSGEKSFNRFEQRECAFLPIAYLIN